MCHCGNTGVERTPNKSRHTKCTLEKKILPPLLPGFEPATFRSRVRLSYQQAIPNPREPKPERLVTCKLIFPACQLWMSCQGRTSYQDALNFIQSQVEVWSTVPEKSMTLQPISLQTSYHLRSPPRQRVLPPPCRPPALCGTVVWRCRPETHVTSVSATSSQPGIRRQTVLSAKFLSC